MRFRLAVLWSIAGACAAVATAATKMDVYSLKGLKDVTVTIEAIPGGDQWGLSQSQLQVDVELRLRKAGIRVVSSSELSASTATVYVRVSISPSNISEARRCYDMGIELMQNVALVRDPSIFTVATTWSTPGGGFSNPDHIRSRLGDMVDEFINDYLTANPKK